MYFRLRAFEQIEILGQSLGLDVPRGVNLPVVFCAALGTDPDAFSVGTGGAYLTADGTNPCGRSIAVNQNERLALSGQLVTQALPKHPETAIQRVSRQRLLF